MWLSAEEAIGRLGVKPQTLYANVSRGRVRAKPDPKDPRRSLYSKRDVERLAERRAGRPSAGLVAVETIRWGEPVLESGVSTVIDGRLYFRGEDVAVLAETATFEDVARLLWVADRPPNLGSEAEIPQDSTPFGPLFAALVPLATSTPPSHGRSLRALQSDAEAILATIAATVAGPGKAPIHQRLAARYGRPDAADPMRKALVLLADHELNASTFAARVAVSTGASLAAGAIAGLAALTGPLHGSAALGVRALARRASEIGAEAAMTERLAEGRAVPALGHPLYPDGDIRAKILLAAIPLPRPYDDLAKAAEHLVGEVPNVDFALAALADAFELPPHAPLRLFALSRTAGWLAHMLEQATTGALIRPRARYIGPKP
jgi:citrate synthase